MPFFERSDRTADQFEVDATEIGERDLPAFALEQIGPNLLFKLPDLLADR